MGHTQGAENFLADKVGVGLARHGGDERLDQGEAVITIDRHFSGGMLEALAGKRGHDLSGMTRHREKSGAIPVVGPRQAGRVTKQLARGDAGVGLVPGHPKIRDILDQGHIQVDQPAIDQYQGRHGGEDLTARGQAEAGVGGGRQPPGFVDEPEGLGPHDALMIDQGQGDGGRAAGMGHGFPYRRASVEKGGGVISRLETRGLAVAAAREQARHRHP